MGKKSRWTRKKERKNAKENGVGMSNGGEGAHCRFLVKSAEPLAVMEELGKFEEDEDADPFEGCMPMTPTVFPNPATQNRCPDLPTAMKGTTRVKGNRGYSSSSSSSSNLSEGYADVGRLVMVVPDDDMDDDRGAEPPKDEEGE